MSLADQLKLSGREKLVFLANPEEWSKQNATRYGFHDIAAGNTGAYGDPTDGGKTYMANQFFRNDNVTGMQTANGTQNVQSGPLSADDIAKRQTALNGAMEAAKPMSVPEGGTVLQPAVNPALVAGMGGAGAAPTQGGGVLFRAPKTYAPTAGGADIGPSATDDDLITNLAQQVAGGGALPSLGVGKSAVALKTAILSRAAQIQKAGGIDGFNALYGKGDQKAAVAALVKQRAISNMMAQAEQQMNANLDAGLAAARNGGAAPGIPMLSGVLQQGRRMAGDPSATTEHGFIDTAGEELAKLTSGSMGNTAATDSARHDAKSRINSGMPLKQLEAAAAVAKKEAHNRLLAARDAEERLRQQIVQGSYGQNAAMGASVNQPSVADQLRAKSAAARGAAPGWQIVGVQ